VLFYNWADYRDPEKRGGGVNVYQRNLIDGLRDHGGIETAFLSSGLAHDLRSRTPHVVTLEGGDSPRYALVNSGLVAPSHADFGGAAQLDDPATEDAFAAFVERTGPWDVIHFNNLEGLPANVLTLKARWPATRFVLSLHNYYPFCPQVNLWFQERETCPGFDGGTRCTSCLTVAPNPRSIRLAYAIGWTLTRIGAGSGTALYDKGFRPVLGLAWASLRRAVQLRRRLRNRRPEGAPPPPVDPARAAAFAERRQRMVALINAHCDAVLCVSQRVQQIAAGFGIDPTRLHTRLIGTREAEAWPRTRARDAFLQPDGTLRLAYLGYMRRDKGFHFLMEALAALPAEAAQRIHLTVAARKGPAEAMALLGRATAHLGALRHLDGYTHDQLDALLAQVDLGVVPVVWEDNLPQVAIEMHARHIPLLASDRGGARELGRCADLVFRAGDPRDFARVLGRVLDGSVTPGHYWRNAIPPVSMDAHLESLLALYRETA